MSLRSPPTARLYEFPFAATTDDRNLSSFRRTQMFCVTALEVRSLLWASQHRNQGVAGQDCSLPELQGETLFPCRKDGKPPASSPRQVSRTEATSGAGQWGRGWLYGHPVFLAGVENSPQV